MTNNFKPIIDRMKWVQVPPAPNAHAAGISICSDMRNSAMRHRFIYQLATNAVLNRYDIKYKGWTLIANPALTTTFGSGVGCVFAPSAGISGSIGAGCTTTSIVTTTSITAVGINQLANHGGAGENTLRIRIKGNSAGGSGKTEERWIVGNTAGTTPTILLDSALSFTPANGDSYEILSGSVYMLGAGTLASGSWRSYEVAAGTLTTRTQTNLPATIGTDSCIIALDEQYVPNDANPGEGFIASQTGTYSGGNLKCSVATATAAGTLTGQASGGDAGVAANLYRNFQIRIVEDTGTPTSVGQRRIIASHTAGASPVYTLGTSWTVTPSSTAKYVIEYPNLIIVRTSATAVLYTYNYTANTINNGTNSINADAFSTSYFGNAGGAVAAGCCILGSWGFRPDAAGNAKNSFVYMFRGGAATTCDCLDIAGGTTGTFDNAFTYEGGQLLTTGSCACYAPCDQEGRLGYINFYTTGVVNQLFRFDVKNRYMEPAPQTDFNQSGTAAVGERLASVVAIDGTDKYTVVLLLAHAATNAMELLVMG